MERSIVLVGLKRSLLGVLPCVMYACDCVYVSARVCIVRVRNVKKSFEFCIYLNKLVIAY